MHALLSYALYHALVAAGVQPGEVSDVSAGFSGERGGGARGGGMRRWWAHNLGVVGELDR